MIVGTAGHIDHGKTALLLALTGQAGDQRQEERARGMTIDLGYRYAALSEGAPLTGFIDVPGHERFIHNMLAGAHGIDLVLLVVAADDGVMPQTREHLAIIELLGIPHALVAISKCDRVEPSRLAEVQMQVSELLAPGPYAGARQFPLSSISGEGVDALRQALLEAEAGTRQRSVFGGFRLAVDRAFAVTGAVWWSPARHWPGGSVRVIRCCWARPARWYACVACMHRTRPRWWQKQANGWR